MKDHDLEKLFLNKKPVDLLIQLEKHDNRNYASALSTDADVTYSHTVKCLQRMERYGLVEFERKGRKKEIKLTDQGDQIAENLFDLMKAMTGDEETEDEDSVIEDSSL
ncbi:winged helix DNA-binding protein [Candidatus Nanohalococcus occultus]|uniref:Transcriptional regulator, contains HTH domain n=1 Tax=Candidatus Nanohalococcus occultus TaxID=2978047 RepID=A0ABY8CD10_9ARCH|nr:Transcriptional regulator, contains HTH domain [Candidatus Nanohaloarchaeota archaeon SVXNc]